MSIFPPFGRELEGGVKGEGFKLPLPCELRIYSEDSHLLREKGI
jgi:hypothetical protein